MKLLAKIRLALNIDLPMKTLVEALIISRLVEGIQSFSSNEETEQNARSFLEERLPGSTG